MAGAASASGRTAFGASGPFGLISEIQPLTIPVAGSVDGAGSNASRCGIIDNGWAEQ